MKKISTLLFVVIALSASAQRTLIHYWNFNATAAITDTAILFKPTYTTGGASLNYAGTGAVTAFAFTIADSTNQRLPETDPTTVDYIKVAGPYAPFTWTLPTTGFKNIIVSFATYASSKGSKINTITYTLDGKTWDSAGMILVHNDYGSGSLVSTTTTGKGTYYITNTTGAPMDSIGLDFSNIPGANDNPLFQVKTSFDPAATAGNERYNNLAVDGISTALALSLQSFTGSIANNQANLNWNTVNEVNTKSFTIEASTDRISFSTLGSVSAKNIVGLNNYSFQTTAPATTTYYRLKITDKVGTVSYSSVVVLNNASTIKLNTFPNPAQNVLNVSLVNAKNETALVQVISALGKVVKQQNVQLVAGTNSFSLAIDNLAKGSYTVVIKGDATQQKQFIKN
jgi:hypothetical protein